MKPRVKDRNGRPVDVGDTLITNDGLYRVMTTEPDGVTVEELILDKSDNLTLSGERYHWTKCEVMRGVRF